MQTVYVKFKDNAGNWSTAYSDTIILDSKVPFGSLTYSTTAPTNQDVIASLVPSETVTD